VDWERAGDRYRDRIMQYLEDRHMPNLQQHIVTERRVDPRYFQNTLNSYLGSAFSVQPTLFQSAYWRPHNQDRDIPNLYLCGAGTHPGAGVPGVISSGKIVADLIGKAAGERRRTVAGQPASVAV
jgi:phytoene desaturase